MADDARNQMLRVERFDIAFLRKAGAPVPLAPREKSATAPSGGCGMPASGADVPVVRDRRV